MEDRFISRESFRIHWKVTGLRLPCSRITPAAARAAEIDAAMHRIVTLASVGNSSSCSLPPPNFARLATLTDNSSNGNQFDDSRVPFGNPGDWLSRSRCRITIDTDLRAAHPTRCAKFD